MAAVHPPFGLVACLARAIGRVRPETGGAAKRGDSYSSGPGDAAPEPLFIYQKKPRWAVITRPLRVSTSSTSL